MSKTLNPEMIQLKARLNDARGKMVRGEATVEEVFAVADEYIAFLKRMKKEKFPKMRIPTRSEVLRKV